MRKKTIEVPDVKREYVRYVIARYSESSWAEQILFHLMDHAVKGIVHDITKAAKDIESRLGIDNLMYRQQIHKLKRKGFIKSVGYTLILHPMLALDSEDFDSIEIRTMQKK